MDVQPVGGAAPATHEAAQLEAPQQAKPIEPATLEGSDGGDSHKPLSAAIAKLFGGALPNAEALKVSYRVEKPNEVVTVFSDPVTGKEVVQFPAETMIQIAQFFDKSSGVTLDRNA